MMIDSFSITIGRNLYPDEIEYIKNATKNVFDKYAVTYDKLEVKFENDEDKKRVEELIKTFMMRLTKLMTHYIFSRTEAFILYKELRELKGLPPTN
jgi:hypothetical protein